MSDNNDRTNLSGGPDVDTAGREHAGNRKEKEGSPVRARAADERSGAPIPTHGPDPTAEDPFVAGAMDESGGVEPLPLDEREKEAVQMQKHDPDGPSYEAHQDPEDRTGGSSDASNSLSFSDSGDESLRR